MASQTSASCLLPAELWHHVLMYMRLQPLELDSASPSEAFCSQRAALRELCLTSRWLLNLARPYLYETVILFISKRAAHHQGLYAAGAGSVLLLARSLAQNHELRLLIRNLSLPIPLSPGSLNSTLRTAPIWRELHSLLPLLEAADLAIFDSVGLSTSRSNDSMDEAKHAMHLENLSPKLVAALLSMTYKVDRLLLQGLLTQQCQEFDGRIQQLMDRSDTNIPFLPGLKTLQLQAACYTASGSGPWEALSQAQISLPLLDHPGLYSIDVACNWLGELDVSPKVLKGIARLKEIKVNVNTGISRIETLVGLAVGVKSLSLTLQSPSPPLPPGSERDGDLNEMLLSRSETLESFSLDTTLCLPEHTADQLGPLDKLTCLPKLHHLTHLSVEPHLLIDWLEVNTWPRFLNTLPPNLVHLTFRFVPEHGQDLLRIWARSGLGSVLRSPREKWQSKLPHLRHIHLHPLPYSLRTVEVIKEDLVKCGIALTWQYLEKEEELQLDIAKLSIH